MKKDEMWKWRWVRMLFVCALLFIIYVELKGMLMTAEWTEGKVVFRPFAVYRAAMRNFAPESWRALIYSICLFIPVGVLLPLSFSRLHRAWAAIAVFLLGTVLIEGLQLLTGRGICAVDDVMNHFAGAMIGYGFYRFGSYLAAVRLRNRIVREMEKKNSYKESKLWEKEKEKFRRHTRIVPVLLFQLPLLMVVGLFIGIFVSYGRQELGNLSCAYAARATLTKTKITVRTSFSGQKQTAGAYRAVISDDAEARQLARKVFSGIKRTIASEDVTDGERICYRDSAGEVELWWNRTGNTYMLTDYSRRVREDGKAIEGKSKASEEEIRAALAEWRINLPSGCSFRELGEGQYAFDAERIKEGEHFRNGTLICDYNVNGRISRVDNRIPDCVFYKDYELMTEQEAYRQLIAGKFYAVGYENGSGIRTLELNGISLDYSLDSKGFYQPVYRLSVVINAQETKIDIPAIR